MNPGYGHPHGSQQIRCEVCEAVQLPATFCAQCGMPLRVPKDMARLGDPPITRLAELEPTSAEPLGEIGTALMPGLESTRVDPVLDLPSAPIPGFEMTADVLIDLPGEDPVMPGLERTSEDFERTAPPATMPVGCPWCGHPQAEGRMCDNCGRSRLRILPPEKRLQAIADDETPRVRCRSCGLTVAAARLCSDCGQPLPPVST